ncbi:MAG: hypothetical protein ACLUD0_05050 [Eubacterium ramulus]
MKVLFQSSFRKGEKEGYEKTNDKSPCTGDDGSYADQCTTVLSFLQKRAPADAATTAEPQPEMAMQAAEEEAAVTALTNGVDQWHWTAWFSSMTVTGTIWKMVG